MAINKRAAQKFNVGGFNFRKLNELEGHAVAQFVEALRYKSEGRGFDSRWCH